MNHLYGLFTKLLNKFSKVLAIFLDLFPSNPQFASSRRNQLINWIWSLGAIHNIERLVSIDVPWWPYKAIREIEKFAYGREIKVFEWGSGASTIWMLKRGFSVISVEHDLGWSEIVSTISKKLNLNFNLIVEIPVIKNSETKWSQRKGYENSNFENYVNAMERFGEFDLIVIDGRAREACLEVSRKHLSEGGIILLDNSNRKRYRSGIEDKFTEKKLRGLTPASPLPTQSSILKPKFR